MSSFYSEDELQAIGFESFGQRVQISRKASIYNPRRIRIGSNVRIDDFCILSSGEGGIRLGSYVHVAAYCQLVGRDAIILNDFSGLSARVSIFSSSDDYSGKSLTNPTVPPAYTGVKHGKVEFGRHTIVGAGAVVLPGVTCGDGVAIGSLSLVNRSCESFGIYAGTPARKLGERFRDLLALERQLLDDAAERGR